MLEASALAALGPGGWGVGWARGPSGYYITFNSVYLKMEDKIGHTFLHKLKSCVS